MRSSLKVKGKGVASLEKLARELGEKPHVKIGVLQNNGGRVSVQNTVVKATSVSRPTRQVTVRRENGRVIGAKGNTGVGSQRAKSNAGAGKSTTVTGQSDNRGAITMAELAAIHEFGAPRANIPARSFLRSTADQRTPQWMALMERLLKGAVAGKLDVQKALELLGLRAAADVQAQVRRGLQPPLKPETVRRKGSSKPLIDTGRLVMAISYQVVRGQR